jgi:predicted RecA/RadA family phage recombinase
MKTRIQSGATIDVTLAATITAGTGLLIGTAGVVGVATTDGAIGDTIAFATEGVFEMAMDVADTVGQGEPLYWDEGNKRWTTVALASQFAGRAWEAAATATLVKVKLYNGGKDVAG